MLYAVLAMVTELAIEEMKVWDALVVEVKVGGRRPVKMTVMAVLAATSVKLLIVSTFEEIVAERVVPV